MKDAQLISAYGIKKYEFQNIHSNGNLISFSRPCVGYVLKGNAEFLYRGRNFYAEQGDTIYIAAGTKYYSIWWGQPDIAFYSIDFAFAGGNTLSNYRFQILSNFGRTLFDEMYQLFLEEKFFLSVAAFYRLLAQLYPKMEAEQVFRETVMLAPAISFIEENYAQTFTIQFLAELCHCSESHFYALFKKATGVSPITYKHQVMIQHALNMLRDDSLNIEQISEQLGFSSSNYFRKVFHTVTRQSPRDFKKGRTGKF